MSSYTAVWQSSNILPQFLNKLDYSYSIHTLSDPKSDKIDRIKIEVYRVRHVVHFFFFHPVMNLKKLNHCANKNCHSNSTNSTIPLPFLSFPAPLLSICREVAIPTCHGFSACVTELKPLIHRVGNHHRSLSSDLRWLVFFGSDPTPAPPFATQCALDAHCTHVRDTPNKFLTEG